MKICLLGVSFDTTNNGVRALSASVIRLIVSSHPHAEIFLLTQSRTSEPVELTVEGKTVRIHRVNCRRSFRAKFHEHVVSIVLAALLWRLLPIPLLRRTIEKRNRWVSSIRGSDRIGDIFGGDSFSDIYSLRHLFLNLIERSVVLILGKRIDFLPQTYGPFASRGSRILAHFFLSRAGRIYSRDMDSIRVVSEILRKKKTRVTFCPDVAFTLEFTLPSNVAVTPSVPFGTLKGAFGLNVSGLLYTRASDFVGINYRRFINDLARAYMAQYSTPLLLIPHTFGIKDPADSQQDLFACRQVYNEVQSSGMNKLYLIDAPYDQYDIKGIIGCCSFFAGSRMHACIAALSQGIPAVGIAYSKKFSGVFEAVGAEGLIVDARSESSDAAIKRILDLFAARSTKASELTTGMPQIRKKVQEVFDQWLA